MLEQARLNEITFFEHNYIMRVLELLYGTESVGNVCNAIGMDVVSLDRDMPADIRSDIMGWDYTTYKPNDFDVIWATLYGPLRLALNIACLIRRASGKKKRRIGYRSGNIYYTIL